MPLRERAAGTIVSLRPPKAVLALIDKTTPCKLDQPASVQIEPPAVISGKVVNVENQECEIELSEALSATARLGQRVSGLVETGVMRDVIFFERPANSSANSDAFVFVIEPAGQYARRVRVHYGRLSGSMIQVLSGLSPGDRVIVTDTSKWNARPRLRLQ